MWLHHIHCYINLCQLNHIWRVWSARTELAYTSPFTSYLWFCIPCAILFKEYSVSWWYSSGGGGTPYILCNATVYSLLHAVVTSIHWFLWLAPDFGGRSLDTYTNCGWYRHFYGTIIHVRTDRNPNKMGSQH